MDGGVVFVVVYAELPRIPLEEEILPVEIGDDDFLVSQRERVQPAISIFFQEVEVSNVVLIEIGFQVAEKSDAGLFVHENEPTEIAVEPLDARANGNEIIVRAEVVDLHLRKRLLQSKMRIEARGAGANIDVDDTEFSHVEIVEAHRGSDSNAPVHRAK